MNELNPLDADALTRAGTLAREQILATTTLAQLKEVKVALTGPTSPLALASKAIGSLPGPDRAVGGKNVGALRAVVTAALSDHTATLEAAAAAALLGTETMDMSIPVPVPAGARHPLSALTERIVDVFTAMGWEVAEGPELEAEWFNFDALNFGPDHPARQMQDTFFVDPPSDHLALRTHTSPVQARAMIERGVPLYIIVPGKVFRTDELDATHTPVFHQVEGLAIDKGLTMANLRGTLDHFARAMFGPHARTRLRPSFFPFTEPSAEMDLECFICTGTDSLCRTCGGTGWIEWGGCGMVNPNVLRAVGVDPDQYQGFAFGMGIERTLMFRHGVADMHDMVEGDARFARHYGMEI